MAVPVLLWVNRHWIPWSLEDGETDRLWHLELMSDGEAHAERMWPAEEEAEADSAPMQCSRFMA